MDKGNLDSSKGNAGTWDESCDEEPPPKKIRTVSNIEGTNESHNEHVEVQENNRIDMCYRNHLPVLTSQMLMIVNRAFESKPQTTISRMNALTITSDDFKALQPHFWLNDSVVNYYFKC